MNAIVQPAHISGNITAAASKSAMQRACAAALLNKGKTILINPGISNDDKAALQIIQQLGATVEAMGDEIHITSAGLSPRGNELDCGESGLSVRMFTSIAALHNEQILIRGKGSLLKRPLHFFDEVLPQLSVDVHSNNGYLPLTVKGPLLPRNITIDGALSSQYLTGLLIAFAAAGAKDVTIHVSNLASKPYIDLTLSILKDFHLKVPLNSGYTSFYFNGEVAERAKQPITYSVEGDWSGAAFLLVAGAIAGDLIVHGLDVFSSQADKKILEALMSAEASISIAEKEIRVSKKSLKAFHFDATDCPDLFPPLVALAAYCNGTTVIEGVSRLTHKESNRGITLQQEFAKLGIAVELRDNLMIIKGGAIKAAMVHSHEDHRIAMACAVAALGADGAVAINGAEAVNKSYPQFWSHLQQLNVPVSLTNNQ